MSEDRDVAIEEKLGELVTGQRELKTEVVRIGDRVTSLEAGQAEIAATVTGIDRRLIKVEITREGMRDDIKALAEGHAATQAAIVRSTDRVIAYIDERISPIEQAVRHLSR